MKVSSLYGRDSDDDSDSDEDQNSIIKVFNDLDSKEFQLQESNKEDSKTEDSKTEDSKTEDSKTEDSKTEDSKTEDSKTEDSKTEDSKSLKNEIKKNSRISRKSKLTNFIDKLNEFISDYVNDWNSDKIQRRFKNIVEENIPKIKNKLKDPNAPKRAKTSYIIFTCENREKMKKKYPQLSMIEINKKLSALWRNLSDDKKNSYKEKSEIDKQRYNEELSKYEKPKKSLNSYNIYFKDELKRLREKYPGTEVKHLFKQVSQNWKNIDEKLKKKYEKLAKKDKIRFESELDTYTKGTYIKGTDIKGIT
jgi:hypothetical protein